MPARNKSKMVKKNKYKKVSFKLSDKQKRVIDSYCDSHKITPNKFYKVAIREYLGNYANLSPEDEYYISENQLKLFDDTEEIEEVLITSEDEVKKYN